jgi:leader peptidase (prepilin peptidase) / N-methyltransferase
MAVGTWAVATLCAGVLGWLGPYVIARLPASADAEPDSPSYADIAGAKHLSNWLALSGMIMVTIVALAVPATLLPAWVLVCGIGSWLIYVDWRTNLLPTRIVWPLYLAALIAVGAEAWLAEDLTLLIRAVVASLVAFGVFWIFWWVGELWRSGGFGYGDVRLSAPLGLVLGSVGGWVAGVGLYVGIILGGVVGIILKMRGRDDAFALGPWLVVGAVLGPLVARAAT